MTDTGRQRGRWPSREVAPGGRARRREIAPSSAREQWDSPEREREVANTNNIGEREIAPGLLRRARKREIAHSSARELRDSPKREREVANTNNIGEREIAPRHMR